MTNDTAAAAAVEKKKVRLYLDVDGVINASSPQLGWIPVDDIESVSEGIAVVGGQSYRIRWSPQLIQALLELDVDIVWTTTWRDSAVLSLGPLVGLKPEYRVLHPISGVTTFPSIFWKEESIRAEQYNNPSPFIHFDDEIDFWLADREAKMGGLAISPDPNIGITAEHIQQAIAYIEAHK